jgi:Na+/melibiose symporter-like transporter
VWQLFPIHLTFSCQNRQLSIVIVVNVFSWIDFKIYHDFFNFIYRSIINYKKYEQHKLSNSIIHFALSTLRALSTKPLQTALCNKYIHYTITFSLDKMFGWYSIKVITKLPNSAQSYKGKVDNLMFNTYDVVIKSTVTW